MAKCNRCGETNLLVSDLCGVYGCVYCAGSTLHTEDVCESCGRGLNGISSYIGSNGVQCFDCFKNSYK